VLGTISDSENEVSGWPELQALTRTTHAGVNHAPPP